MLKAMNTLKIEAELASKYQYKKLPLPLSLQYRKFFEDNIPEWLSIDGGGQLFTKNGTLICQEYQSIVVGDYGAFVEFDQPAFPNGFIVAPGQEYRLNDERYKNHVKYYWLTINDGSNIKIYHQRAEVDYADYTAGKYYVSVHEVYKEAH